MLGAIAGDVIGSVFEFNNVRSVKFPLFCSESTYTDDSVLTFAVADCILNKKDYAQTIRAYSRAYPKRGYGGRFRLWIEDDAMGPYNSFGNGSAMRVSPVGWAFDSEAEVLAEAKRSAEVTHNHPEGIKGAQAVALAIFLARTGSDKAKIKDRIQSQFGYNLRRTLDSIRPEYRFDETCQGSVAEAIIAFLESADFESAIRGAISLGGDSDTIACMAGGIAEAFYKGVPQPIEDAVLGRLPAELKAILVQFGKRW